MLRVWLHRKVEHWLLGYLGERFDKLWELFHQLGARQAEQVSKLRETQRELLERLTRLEEKLEVEPPRKETPAPVPSIRNWRNMQRQYERNEVRQIKAEAKEQVDQIERHWKNK